MVPAALRHLLRNTPTIAPVPHRAILYVYGSQSSEFLNGILASTVPIPPRGPFYSAFLHAQGRVLYDVFVYPKKSPKGHDGYIIEYDPRSSEAPPLLPSLKRYVLRKKVKIEDVSDSYDVWASWGFENEQLLKETRHWNIARSGAFEPIWDTTMQWPWSAGEDKLILRDIRGVGMGKRMLVLKGNKPSEATSHDIVDHTAYTLHRILHGVPEGIDDVSPMHAFPMESNLDIMGGLDFRKGCYVGQELTVRTYHTGVLRKRIIPVYITRSSGVHQVEEHIAPNPDIKTVHDSACLTTPPRIRGTGKLLSNVHGVGLALLRLEHVDLVQRGLAKFQLQTGQTGQDEVVWDVSHWWPDWWPNRGIQS